LVDEISLDDLVATDLQIIRSWLSSRKISNFSNSSSSRSLSGVKNFYKFLYQITGKINHAIINVKSPKKQNTLPKALSYSEVMSAIKQCCNSYREKIG
jgi:site-specific recombinase XerD